MASEKGVTAVLAAVGGVGDDCDRFIIGVIVGVSFQGRWGEGNVDTTPDV